ncbi:hypothetical protein BDR07DRAFT_1378917 [Suillus spraguei]|nr:hypothetical protein BDR07DRAFT_1378917 [Suillus spraguei]
MQQPEKLTKKPRLTHPDLAASDLTPEERQRERVRRWHAKQKLNPDRAREIKERNTANKRAWRKRMKEEQAQNQQPADVDSQDKAPRKRRRITHPEPQPDAAALSNSARDEIPIDPVLLSQDATVTARLMRDVEVLTNIPDPLVNTPSLMRDVEVMTDTPDPLVNTPLKAINHPLHLLC